MKKPINIAAIEIVKPADSSNLVKSLPHTITSANQSNEQSDGTDQFLNTNLQFQFTQPTQKPLLQQQSKNDQPETFANQFDLSANNSQSMISVQQTQSQSQQQFHGLLLPQHSNADGAQEFANQFVNESFQSVPKIQATQFNESTSAAQQSSTVSITNPNAFAAGGGIQFPHQQTESGQQDNQNLLNENGQFQSRLHSSIPDVLTSDDVQVKSTEKIVDNLSFK